MRFLGFAVLTSVVVLGACGGGDKAATTDTTTAAVTPAATDTPPPAAAAAGTMMPITGTTHEVKMYGDATGYRFEPAELTIKAGDGVKFITVNGAPHNVFFDAAAIPAAGKAQLDANMPEKMMELTGKMLAAEGESYTISFAGVAAGEYVVSCTPHMAMNMKGKIIVQ